MRVFHNHRMEAHVVGEVILQPFRVFHESRLLRDPQFQRAIFGREIQKTQRETTGHHQTDDDERARTLRHCNSPAVVNQ